MSRNGVAMKFDYSKTLNEQLPTFNYYRDRYCSYELEILELQQENQQLKIQISAREEQYRKLEDNWNKLKQYAKDNLYFYSGYQGEDLETDIAIQGVLNKMQELERGVSDE